MSRVVVEGDIDSSHSNVIEGWWNDTRHLGRVDHSSLRCNAKIMEDAESVIGIVDDEWIVHVDILGLEHSVFIIKHSNSVPFVFLFGSSNWVTRKVFSEWEHTCTYHQNLVTTALRSVVWIELGDCWIGIVPIIDELAGILLLVERDREANRLG